MQFKRNLLAFHAVFMLLAVLSLRHCEALSVPHLRNALVLRNSTAGTASLSVVKSSKQALSSLDVLIAGALARLLAQLILHPLDAYRTRVQLFGPSLSPHIKGHVVAAATFLHRIQDFFNIALKGIAPLLLLAAPAGALQFSTLEYTKYYMKSLPIVPLNLLASALGSLTSSLLKVPLEVLKQGIQADLYSTIGSAILHIYAHEGIAGYYKGSSVTILRDTIWNSVSYMLYEYFVLLYQQRYGGVGDRAMVILGAVAGIVSSVITQPLDVAKTKIMVYINFNNVKYSFVNRLKKRILWSTRAYSPLYSALRKMRE